MAIATTDGDKDKADEDAADDEGGDEEGTKTKSEGEEDNEDQETLVGDEPACAAPGSAAITLKKTKSTAATIFTGCKYLIKIKKKKFKDDEDSDKEDNLDGDNEDERDFGAGFKGDPNRPKLLASNATIGKYFGQGVELYFRYLLFIVVTDIFAVACVLVNFIPHCVLDLSAEDWKIASITAFDSYYGKRKLLYLSSYTTESFYYWFISILILAVTWITYGPLYYFIVGKFFATEEVDKEERYAHEDDIEENESVTHFQRSLRFLVSLFVFWLMLGVAFGCTFTFTILEKNFMHSTLASTAISLVVTIVRLIWTQIAGILTRFERHPTWSAFKNHLLLKWYCFKVFNIIGVYISRWIVMDRFSFRFSYSWDLPDFPWEDDSGSTSAALAAENSCGLVYMGDQFLSLIIIDLIVSNAIEVAFPLGWPLVTKLLGKIKTCCCKRGARHDLTSEDLKDTLMVSRSDRPEFDIAEEYLEVLYRQFVIFLGIPFFPLLALLSLLVNLLEILVDRIRLIYICKKPPKITVDRIRLIYICKKPPKITGSLKRQLVLYTTASVLLVYASFPVGTAWIFAGYDYGDPEQCPAKFWPWSYLDD
ncbi:DUF590 family protein [Pelomyxa schiedti]|nr:DUF590 family protein [Pelomyxa schiedti]